MSEPDDLSIKLRAWQVNPSDAPGFEREVWQRIAQRKEPRREALWRAALFNFEPQRDAHDSNPQ